MNALENFRSIIQRTGYEKMPVEFSMCPFLQEKFDAYCKENDFTVPCSMAYMPGLQPKRPLRRPFTNITTTASGKARKSITTA